MLLPELILIVSVSASASGGARPEASPHRVYLPFIAHPAPTITFTHGVASSEVTTTSAVLWTRGDRAGDIRLEVAADSSFSQLVHTSTLPLSTATDFTAQGDVANLTPHQRYFYRWRAGAGIGSHVSPTGSFKTAPLPTQAVPLRFAYSGDSDGALVGGQPGYNHFEALDAIRSEQPDFFVYLGDTIYADSGLLPQPAQTLDEYRAAYKTNRALPALPNLLAAVSTYAIWDDHEVLNDYAGQTVDPSRYANGRQAFLEYLPVRAPTLPAAETTACAGPPLFRVFHWGSDADLIMLDERSCRSADVSDHCLDGNGVEDLAPTLPAAARLLLGLPAVPPVGCREAINDPSRTFLGAAQKLAFQQTLRTSTARFKFVINETPIQQYYAWPYDRWEGYAAERNEILDFIRGNDIANVIFLTADAHANMMNEVYIDKYSDPEPIAYEAVTGPIAALTLEQAVARFDGPQYVAKLHATLDLIGIDCRDLDSYSYGLVEVNVGAGTASITLKDDAGAVITDQRNPAIRCAKTVRLSARDEALSLRAKDRY